VSRPGVRGQDHQVDAIPASELVEFSFELGIVGEEPGVGSDGFGHLEPDRAVGDADRAGAEQRPECQGAQAQHAQPDDRHVLARLEVRLAIAQCRQGTQPGVDRVGVLGTLGHLHQRAILVGDVVGLVRQVADNAVPDREPRDVLADPADDSQVAVTDPARIVGRPGHLLGTLEVPPVGPDLQRADAGPDPDLLRPQVVGVERLLFDPQVTRSVQDGDFHPPHCTGVPNHEASVRRHVVRPASLRRGSVTRLSRSMLPVET